MKKIRIGKDIGVRWKIRTPFNDDPLSVSDISIDMKDPRGTVVPVEGFEITGDTVTFGLKGTAFAYLGDYTFSCWKNKGKDGQTVVDAVNAFTLVNSTDKETGVGRGGCGVLELNTVDLYSELEFFFSGEFVDADVVRRVTALETVVAGLTTQISSMQTMISELNARVTALEDGGGGGEPGVIEITGIFSYPSVTASGGTVNPTNTMQLTKNGVAQQVSFTFSSNQSYASVNNSTGVVTFSASQSASQRSATITASCTFEGQTYSRTATVTQAAYEATVYSVSRTLTGVISSNTDNSVNEGSSYTTTLTLASGYQNMSVTVTMGGVDITSSALSDNVVSIASVTGNVVITATATQIPVEVEYIYGGGAFSTASSISYADLVIDTTVDASTKTITFGVDNQNHIGIIAPASLTLTSCLHIDAITEDLTAEFASSAQTITYNGKTMKLYQVKSTAGKMYNTTFRANFS